MLGKKMVVIGVEKTTKFSSKDRYKLTGIILRFILINYSENLI